MTTVHSVEDGEMAAFGPTHEEAALLHPGVQELDGITLRASRGYDPFEGWSSRGRSRGEVAAWTVVVFIGVLLGVFLPRGDAAVPGWAATASAVMGWCYFMIWTVSFYPQMWVNYRRRSVIVRSVATPMYIYPRSGLNVAGLSFDFVLYNEIGFLCYAAFSCALMFSPGVRQSYRARHNGQEPGVRLNDVVFALHASLAGAAVLLQIALFTKGGQTVSRTCQHVTAALAVGMAAAMALSLWPAVPWEPLDFFYLLGYVKVVITVIKYAPQVLLSVSRKSTDGFAIGPVLCDFAGGILSIAQQVFDAVMLRDPSIVFGNLVKFGIGWVGIVYNVVMMVQHYVLYIDSKHVAEARGPVAEPLLMAPSLDAKHEL